jgi:Raf kinase inhibitor-like YbhB/YbcL family protein
MKNIVKRVVAILSAAVVCALLALYLRAASVRAADAEYHGALSKSLKVSSSGFEPNGNIPTRFTCLGEGQSPDLRWDDAPADARSYAVIVVDFDVPAPGFALQAFTHWMVYDIPPDQHGLAEAAKTPIAYTPSCPPFGEHAYHFRVYALDLPKIPSAVNRRRDLMNAMRGHIIAYGELVGRFHR